MVEKKGEGEGEGEGKLGKLGKFTHSLFTGVDGFSLSALHQKLKKTVEGSIRLALALVNCHLEYFREMEAYYFRRDKTAVLGAITGDYQALDNLLVR